MKKIFIIGIIILVVIGFFYLGKSLFFKHSRHRSSIIDNTIGNNDTSSKLSVIPDTVAKTANLNGYSSSGITSKTVVGKWVRTKEVDPDGTTKADKDCNVVNYKIELTADNSFTMEFDRTDLESSEAHKVKNGTWRLVKTTDPKFPLNLVLRINRKSGVVEKPNTIITYDDRHLVLIDPENKTQYFNKIN